MVQVPPATSPAAQPSVPTCYRHPKRETYVRCTRCERYICPECMHEASVGHQCPECVAQGRRSVRQARTPFGGTSAGAAGYVTKTLVALNVLVAIASIISAGGGGMFGGGMGGLLGGSTKLLELGSDVGAGLYTDASGARFLGPGGISAGEYYRLVTAMFLHVGVLHLLVNMWALWVLGRNLETVLGPVRFLVLYLVSGLGGNVAVYFLTPDQPSAGSSTAIYGLFAALFVVMRRLGGDITALIPLLVINIIISLNPNISLIGHLGGFVTGAAIAAAFAFAPPRNRNLIATVVVSGICLLMLVAVVVQTVAIRGFVPYD